MESETIYIQKYPTHGYEVRTEMIKPSKRADPQRVRKAYTSRGVYIGTPQLAGRLCQELHIAPELITPEHDTCSIGFCEKDQIWYGWAPGLHPVVMGFCIGSTAELKTIQPIPEPEPDSAPPEEDAKYKAIMRLHRRNKYGTDVEPAPKTPKSGDQLWVAKTLDDAKQMAIDFANRIV